VHRFCLFNASRGRPNIQTEHRPLRLL
jgi:hypothetical protein